MIVNKFFMIELKIVICAFSSNNFSEENIPDRSSLRAFCLSIFTYTIWILWENRSNSVSFIAFTIQFI